MNFTISVLVGKLRKLSTVWSWRSKSLWLRHWGTTAERGRYGTGCAVQNRKCRGPQLPYQRHIDEWIDNELGLLCQKFLEIRCSVHSIVTRMFCMCVSVICLSTNKLTLFVSMPVFIYSYFVWNSLKFVSYRKRLNNCRINLIKSSPNLTVRSPWFNINPEFFR